MISWICFGGWERVGAVEIACTVLGRLLFGVSNAKNGMIIKRRNSL